MEGGGEDCRRSVQLSGPALALAGRPTLALVLGLGFDAVASGAFEGHVATTLDTSLDSHWMALAAEHSRLTHRTIEWGEYRA